LDIDLPRDQSPASSQTRNRCCASRKLTDTIHQNTIPLPVLEGESCLTLEEGNTLDMIGLWEQVEWLYIF
jgi:hypothetical protein